MTDKKLVTDLDWCRYNLSIYIFTELFNKILNLVLGNVGIFDSVW